jgi:tetratricopeptide (TPR) repeat protein
MVENNAETLQPNEGRRIHGLAEQAREEGRFVDALKHTDEAMVAYQERGDKLGFAEVLSSRFLTLRHLHEQTGDRSYLITAKHTVQASVDIAKESGDNKALAIPLFNLAKAQETLGELPDAARSYQEAVENVTNNPSEFHNLPAVAADFKVHMTTCEYKAGDKAALPRAEEALQELEGAEHPDAYAKDVWVSGGYMRMAEMLRGDDPEKAQASLQRAKQIIDANPKLGLRDKQWQKLAATFK